MGSASTGYRDGWIGGGDEARELLDRLRDAAGGGESRETALRSRLPPGVGGTMMTYVVRGVRRLGGGGGCYVTRGRGDAAAGWGGDSGCHWTGRRVVVCVEVLLQRPVGCLQLLGHFFMLCSLLCTSGQATYCTFHP